MRIFILMLVLCVSCNSIAAPDWSSKDAMPTDYDWIKLSSDEWLKGEFKVLYDGSLEFDSDELDLLSFDWADVVEIRTARVIEVRFDDRTVGVGQLRIQGQDVYFSGAKDGHTRAQIVSIATSGTSERDYWSIDVGLSGNYKRGNTDENLFDFNVDAKRRSNSSRFLFTYLASQRDVKNNETDERVVTEDSHRLNSYYDRFISQRLYWRALSYEYYQDQFKNIKNQQTLGSGIGYTLFDVAKFSWDITLSPSFQKTEYVTVSEGEELIDESPAMVLVNEWEYDITSDIEFNALYNATWTNTSAGKYKHHINLGFEFEITDSLDFDVGLIWDRTEIPKPDEEGNTPLQDDSRLTLGISYEF